MGRESRLRSGIIVFKEGGDFYSVVPATRKIEAAADILYETSYEEAKEHDILSDDELLEKMIELGMWTPEKEKELNDITPKHIDYWKEEIFNSYFKSKTRETARAYLKTAEQHLSSLLNDRHQFSQYTAEGIASYTRNLFIFSKCLRGNTKNKGLVQLMNKYSSSVLSGKQLRGIAKSQEWSNLWVVYRKLGQSIFLNKCLTAEQLIVSQWSLMYDNVRENPECPNDDIVEDDDALDGWFIVQRKNRESEKVKSTFGNSKIDNADEVGIIAETQEDAQKILAMNDPHTRSVINSRIKQVADKGIVMEQDLSDVRRNLYMQATNAMSQHLKGG